MVFSLSRLLFLSLSVTSTLARLPPRSDSVRDVSHRSHTIRLLDTTKNTALASAPSPPPCTSPQTGYIMVSSNTTSLNGYLAAKRSNVGAYGSVTNSTQDALRSSFCPDEAAGNKTFNFYISSADRTSNLPCLGAVQSVATTHPGTLDQQSTVFGDAVLGRTGEFARGPAAISVNNSLTPPVPRAVESSVWTMDLQTSPRMPLIPVWTNPNGSLFLPTLLHLNSVASGGMGDFALGNRASSLSGPPSTSETEVTFTFILSSVTGSKGLWVS